MTSGSFRRELARRCLRPRGLFSRSPEIKSYEPQGSVGGDVGQPAIAFAKFYYMSRYFNHNRSWLLPLLLLDVLDSRNFIVSLIYTLYATDIV